MRLHHLGTGDAVETCVYGWSDAASGVVEAMNELTYEEFCQQSLRYVAGMTDDWGAQRMYRNDELGIQQERITERKRYGDIDSGWKTAKNYFFLDSDPREFKTLADLYVAWMARVCGVEE